jgi:transcriptional regulator with XRE-family HTH domain
MKNDGTPANLFAPNLRRLLASKNMTATEAAEAAGLTKQAVGLLLAGARWPTWQTACALADAIGCGMHEFREEG